MPMDQSALDDLKAMLKFARKGPVGFGVCLGKKPANTVLILHRKKAPEMLQRLAKKEGETAKISCGEIEISGKNASLRCFEDPPPVLQKALKTFFAKTVGTPLKVTLLNAEGSVLEGDEDEDAGEPTPTPDEQEAPASDPRIETLKAGAKDLSGQIGGIADSEVRAKLAGAFKKLVEIINRGDAETAEVAFEKLQTMVDRFAGEPAQESPTPPAGDGWAKVVAKIEPQVLTAVKANHPEAGKIRAVWGFAQEKAEAGDIATALKAVKRLTPLLTAEATPAEDAPPVNVVAFQRSRILWIDAKKSMKSDLEKFRAAVAKQSSDDDDQQDVMAAVDDLVKEFNAFDTKLEDVLDEITQTPEGAKRSKLKKDADKAIGTYLAALDTPFFQVIDNNPFVAVNVAGRGKQSLSVVKATLA